MGERIILCNSCGNKTHVERGQRHATCEGCGKPLALRAGSLTGLSRVRWVTLVWVVLLAVLGVAYLANAPLVSTESKSASPRSDLSEIVPTPIFSEPPVHITPGLVNRPKNPSLARLTVRTQAGTNYFVKLVHPSMGVEVMSFYVRGGLPLTVRVPVGTYELRYAAGQIWYGPVNKFGSDTAYAKAEELFHFTVTRTADGWSYSA